MLNLKDERILLTGGSGFLGSKIAEMLAERGADVWCPASENDLRIDSRCGSCFAFYGPTIVIHAAANVGGIGKNQAMPADLFTDNLLMGVNVIGWTNRMKTVKKLVIIGTTCSYPANCRTPFQESDLWNGEPEATNSAYGIAKLALLKMLQAYRQQYGLNGIYLIPTNLYGPGDNFDLETSHVIPAMIRKMLDAKDRGDASVTLWGDGTPTRDFLYVDDAADAIVRATESYESPLPCNLGSGLEFSIVEMAMFIRRHVGYQGGIQWDPSKPNGQKRRLLDTTRANACMVWSARTELVDGLAKTVDWYKENRWTETPTH